MKTRTVELDIPRDRLGVFEPKIIKYQTRIDEALETRVLSMYTKGMSVMDISDHIKDAYNVDIRQHGLQ
ncbi:MAG: transposase [Christensenellaceae bacterium]|nr:transposase [Christensenellaceae bacterium]